MQCFWFISATYVPLLNTDGSLRCFSRPFLFWDYDNKSLSEDQIQLNKFWWLFCWNEMYYGSSSFFLFIRWDVQAEKLHFVMHFNLLIININRKHKCPYVKILPFGTTQHSQFPTNISTVMFRCLTLTLIVWYFSWVLLDSMLYPDCLVNITGWNWRLLIIKLLRQSLSWQKSIMQIYFQVSEIFFLFMFFVEYGCSNLLYLQELQQWRQCWSGILWW